MRHQEIERARGLVGELLKNTRGGSAAYLTAKRLEKLLRPSPTLGNIILSLEALNHKERAKLIGISRQGYYNLIKGQARPNKLTAMRLAELTGLSEEAIREASP